MTLSAVFWDFGGVITTSPFDAFAEYERAHGLPVGFIRGLNATNPDTNAWAAFERGSVDLEMFAARFEEEARLAGGTIDARALIEGLRGEVRPEMAEAVRRCHRVFKTGLLVEAGVRLAAAGHRRLDDDVKLLQQPAVVVIAVTGHEVVGLMACERLGIHPAEAVFLDDLGVNLKPARELGMTTIKVADPDEALAELEAVTGLVLRAR